MHWNAFLYIRISLYPIINYNDRMETVKRSYRSKLRAEQTVATRRRILDAAQVLFARQGYQGTTMEQLAEEAGVAMQTLYAAFGSKVNLAVAVVDEVLASIGIPELSRQAGEVRDAEQVLRYAAHINRLIGERMVDLEALISGANLQELAQASTRKRKDGIAGALATLIASPRRRPDMSDDEIRDALLALTSEALYRTLVKEQGWTPERYEHWLSDLLVAALLR